MNRGEALERFVPGLKGRIKAEHFHRYALALPLAQDKDVLDLACGEGYGSAQLARVARSVVGVDKDAPVIEAAAKRYTQGNLFFRSGVCDAVPLPTKAWTASCRLKPLNTTTGTTR